MTTILQRLIAHAKAEKYDEKCFAMQHCASYLSGTDLEGINQAHALYTFTDIVDATNNAFADDDASIKQSDKQFIRQALQDLSDFLELYDACLTTVKKPQSAIDLQPLLDEIKNKCDEKGYCYLPSGWVNTSGAGHYVSAKISKNADGSYNISFLNRGAGSQFHDQLSKSDEKQKYDYQSCVYRFESTSDSFKLFLNGFLSLVSLSHVPINCKEQDLYGLLALHGKLQESVPDLARQTTPQRSGTCGLTNMALVIKDTLLFNAKLSPIATKRYEFFNKLSSIVVAYKHLQDSPKTKVDEGELQILDLAVKELYVRLQKIHPDGIDDEELNEIRTYADGISASIAAHKKAILKTTCVEKDYPGFSASYNVVTKPITLPQRTDNIEIKEKEPVKPLKLDLFSTPKEVLTRLKEANDYFTKAGDTLQTRWELKKFIRALPKPTGAESDPFWDKAPLNDLSEIIHCLLEINEVAEKNKLNKNDSLELGLISYDVCAQIAPRIPALKLGSEFCLGADDTFSSESEFFEPSTFLAISEIANRFIKRTEFKKPLFNNTLIDDGSMKAYILALLDLPTRQKIIQALNELLKAKKYEQIKDISEGNCRELFFTGSCLGVILDLSPFLPKELVDIRKLACFAQQVNSANLSYKYVNYKYFLESKTYHLHLEFDTLYSKTLVQDDYEAYRRLGYVHKKLREMVPYNEFPRNNKIYRDLAENTVYQPVEQRRTMGYRLPWSNASDGYLTCYDDKNTCVLESLALDESLKRIQVDKGFSVLKSLAWIYQHVKEMFVPPASYSSNPSSVIFNQLFSYGAFYYTLENSPEETNHQIKKTLNHSYAYSNLLFKEGGKCDINGYLDLCDIETLYRVWAQELNKASLLDKDFPSCQTQLRSLFSSVSRINQPKVALALLANLKTLAPFTIEDLQYALASQLILSQIKGEQQRDLLANRCAYQAMEAWHLLRELIKDTLRSKNLEERGAFIYQVLTYMGQQQFVDKDSKWVLEGAFLKSSTGNTVLNLELGTLVINKAELTNVNKEMADNYCNQELMDVLGINIHQLQFSFISDENPIAGCNVLALNTDGETWYCDTDINSAAATQGNPGKIKALKRNMEVNNTSCIWALSYSSNYEAFNEKEFASFLSSHQCSNPYKNSTTKWIDAQNDRAIVEHPSRPNKAMLSDSNGNWHKLSGKRGNWTSTGVVVLNSLNKSISFVNEWQTYLDRVCDPQKLVFKATLNEKNNKLELTTMAIPPLGLHFAIKQGKFYSREHNGFYLSTRQAATELNGLDSALILEKDEGGKKEYKYLLPKSQLKKQGTPFYGRNPLSKDKQMGYILLEKDKKGQLKAKTAEDNFRLSIVFALQGDFQKAMKSLEYSYSHQPNSKEIVDLLLEYNQCKPNTPAAYAFYCQLHLRFLEHNFKWTKAHETTKANINIMEEVEKSAKKNAEDYHNSISTQRHGVDIIPEYLRPSQHYFNFNKKNIDAFNEIESLQHQAFRDEELSSTNEYQLGSTFTANPDGYGNCLDTHIKQPNLPFYPPLKIVADSRHKKGKDSKGQERTLDDDTMAFVNAYFVNLFELALDDNPINIERFNSYMFHIVRSKTTYQFYIKERVAILRYVHGNKGKFSGLRYDNISANLINLLSSKFSSCQILINPEIFTASNMITVPETVRKKPHWLEHKNPPVFSLTHLNFQEAIKHPLQSTLKQFFSIEVKPVLEEMKVPNFKILAKQNPIEREILAKFEQGFAKNRTILRNKFTFKPNALTALQKELPSMIARQEGLLNALENHILSFANQLPDDKNLENIRSMIIADRETGKRLPIDIGSLMASLLNQHFKDIHFSNPLLGEQEVNQLLQWACDYVIEHAKLVQMNETMALVEEYAHVKPFPDWVVQLIGETLDKKRTYSPKEYPEILVYEYTTNTMLREGQAEKIIELIQIIENGAGEDEYRHALLQFRAGGGKTAVLIPILTHRIIRKGLVPVIFNTNELYNIAEQEIPESLKNSLQINVEVIERELDFKWSLSDCTQLLSDLHKWQRQKKCILLKAVSWHSINLAYKSALDENDRSLAKACEDILNFFKTQCVKLEDEGHLISDPLQEYIRTDKPSQTFTLTETDLMLEFYHCLMGQVESCKELADLSGIENKSRKAVNPDELKRIQALLVEHIILHKEFISLDKNALKNYLLAIEKTRPQWLIDIDKNQPQLANSIILASSFIKTHLPHVLTLQYKKDYGTSIYKGDLRAAPKHDSSDVSSHFADPLLLLALTTQLTHQQGVPHHYVEEIFKRLKKAHDEQALSSSTCTEAEIQIIKLLPEKYFLKHIALLEPLELANDESVRNYPPLMDYYLRTYAFPQIKMPTKLYISSPADLQAGFERSIIFSATPGLLETYPVQLKKENMLLAEDFEAEVVSTLLNDSNKEGIMIKDVHSPDDFFAELKKSNPMQFQKMTALIDRGALLSSFDTQKIADALKVILGPDIKAANTLFFNGESMRLEGAAVKPVTLKGTQILNALKEQNIKPEEILIFLFLDLAHTTGTDVKRPYKDRAGLSIGKEQTLTDTIQAAMRERQLLREDAQSIVWVLFQSLYKQINPDSEKFDLKQVLLWMVRNQSKHDEHKILMRAYQALNQLIGAYARKQVAAGLLSMEDIRDTLSKKTTLSIKDMYEFASKMDDTNKVLKAYVKTLCQKYKLSQKKFPETLNQQITRIIEDTHRLIPKILSPRSSELSAETVHEEEETVEQQQQQQQTLKTSWSNNAAIIFGLETYDEKDTLESIFSNKNAAYKPLILPGCEDIPVPSIFFNSVHFNPFLQKDQTNILAMKPVDSVIIQRTTDGKYQFLACTLAGAKLFREQLIKQKPDTNSPAYMIVDGSGELLFKSNNTTTAMVSDCKSSDAFNEAMSYVGLINGKITHTERMSQFIKKWAITQDLYKKLVASVKKIHVSYTPVDLEHIPYLESLCGWSSLDITVEKRMAIQQAQEVETRGSYQPDKQVGNFPKAPYMKNPLSPVVTPAIIGLSTQSPNLTYVAVKLTAEQLHAAINIATSKYKFYHEDPQHNVKFARGDRGFFTSLRHRGYKGRVNTLLNGIKDDVDLKQITQHLDDFINDSHTQFNRHSLSSYVLDAISNTMKANDPNSSGLPLESDGKYQRKKVWEQLKSNQQWDTQTSKQSIFMQLGFR